MKTNNDFIEQYLNELSEKGFFEAIGDGISIQDTNYKILYQNSMHKSFIGEHIGEYCYQAYEKRDSKCEGCPLVMTFKDGLPHTCERKVPMDGGISYFEITSSPLKDKSGEIVAGIEVVRNITERKKVEESFQFLSVITEQISDSIVATNLNFEITYVNNAFKILYGYSGEDLLGKSPNILNAESDADTIQHDIYKTVSSGEVWRGELQNRKKDGSTFPCSLTVFPLHDSEGKIFAYVGAQRDITERRNAENALRESEEKYRLLFSAETDAIIMVDAETLRIIDANDSALKLYGYGKEEIQKLSGPDLSAEPQKSEAAIKEISMATKEHVYYHTRYHKKKDGIVFPVEISSGTFMLKDKKVVSAMIRDITERKKAEDALREKETEIRTLFERMNESFAYHKILTDENGNPVDYVFLLVNDAFERATGLKKDLVTGKRVTELIPGIKDSKPDLIRLYGEVAQKGKEVSFELYFEPFDKWYLVNAYSPIKDHFVSIFSEITDRKLAEQERKHLLAELTRKNKELEQVIYVTSHDLRSPLVNIVGHNKIIAEAVEDIISHLKSDRVPADIQEKIASIMENDISIAEHYITTSVTKMNNLLSGLLQISRLGQVELKKKRLDMNKVISEIKDTMAYKIEASGAKLEISDLPSCKGDELQINQLFSNLVDNALKYLDPARPGIIKISGYSDSSNSVYGIEDNGIGIKHAHQAKIFDIFHQLNPKGNHGEGLGLTIANMIIDRHGGKIWMESEIDVGSKFFISLPTA